MDVQLARGNSFFDTAVPTSDQSDFGVTAVVRFVRWVYQRASHEGHLQISNNVYSFSLELSDEVSTRMENIFG